MKGTPSSGKREALQREIIYPTCRLESKAVVQAIKARGTTGITRWLEELTAQLLLGPYRCQFHGIVASPPSWDWEETRSVNQGIGNYCYTAAAITGGDQGRSAG